MYISRSGSTFLASELNQYEKISVSPENHFVSKVLVASEIDSEKQLTELLDYIFSEFQFQDLKLERKVIEENLMNHGFPVSKKYIIETVLQEYFHSLEKPAETWIVKHAPYPFIEQITNLWPDAFFIHIIRDMRGVYNSHRTLHKKQENPKRFENIFTKVIRWKDRVRNYVSQKNIYVVRYEDLVSNTEDTISGILEFLKYSPAQLEKNESKESFMNKIGTAHDYFHTNITKAGQSSFIDKWQQSLTKSQIILLQWLCRKDLKALGYQIYTDYDFKDSLTAVALGITEAIKFPLFYIDAFWLHVRNGTVKAGVLSKLKRHGVLKAKV